MILGTDELHRLLKATLDGLEDGTGWAVTLEGSIAEGFGNSSSDVDFLLISADGDLLPTMPSVLFVDGRRVEVRTRSMAQIRDQFGEVRAGADDPALLDEDRLNRCQRLLASHPLRGDDLVARAKQLMPVEEFAAVAETWWLHHARHALRQAVAMDVLGQHAEAVGWARSGLTQATKAWAARHGETYLEPKWLSLQLERAGHPEIRDRYWRLDAEGATATAPADHVARCVAFARELGVTDVEPRADSLTVTRVTGVTTWPVGDRVHVVRDRRDVFALGTRAARVWRSLVLGRSLPDVLLAARAVDPAADAFLARFLRYGLARLAWDGTPLAPRLPVYPPPGGPASPPPGDARPVLSLGGAAVSGEDAVDLVPMPADRFSAAAMTLVWSNDLIENLGEDLAGAVHRGQWRAAELAARRIVQAVVRALLSAEGVNPLPPDPDLVPRLDLLPAPARRFRPGIEALRAVTIDDPARAGTVRAALAGLVASVRATLGAEAFPDSFTSAEAWQSTLDLGYDWLRLCAYLDAALPIDEARDLLTSGGTQPHTRR